MALVLTQPLTEMSTRSLYWGGNGVRYVGLTTFAAVVTRTHSKSAILFARRCNMFTASRFSLFGRRCV
jgi:hypothetical protein